jgi:hypothetical protein
MKKILWLLLGGIWAGNLSAAMEGAPSKEMKAFEFEITDLYYPLLSEEEMRTLVRKMSQGAYIWGGYKGDVLEIPSWRYRWKIWPHALAGGSLLPPIAGMQGRRKSVQATGARVEDGKIRFELPAEIIYSGSDEDRSVSGAIPLEGLQISMPIAYLGETLHEKLRESDYSINFDGRYFTFSFSIVPYKGEPVRRDADGFYSRQHRYVREYQTPVANMLVGGDILSGIKGWQGINLWAIGKISEINKDGSLSEKPLVANENEYGSNHLYDQPQLSAGTKMYSIPEDNAGDFMAYLEKDGMDVRLTRNIPANVGNIRARYINRGVLKRFSLFGYAKYKSAGRDETLTSFFLGQTRTREKLFRIDGKTSQRTTDCIFEYAVQFHPEGIKRYFARPRTNEARVKEAYRSNEGDARVWHYLAGNDVAPIEAFERDLRQWFQGQEDAEAKIAACHELTAHAKHILTASAEELEKEFDETYQAIGAQYDKLAKNGFFVGEKQDGKPHGYGDFIYSNGDRLYNAYYDNNGVFKPDNGAYVSSRETMMRYANGNVLTAIPYKNKDLSVRDYEQGNMIGRLSSGKEDACRCSANFVNGKAEGEGHLSVKGKEYEFNFNGNFRNGLAEGNGYLRFEVRNMMIRKDEVIRINIGKEIYVGKNQSRGDVQLSVWNGQFKGDAQLSVWNGKHSEKYAVSFKDGKLFPLDGLDEKIVENLNAVLARIFPIECDTGKKFGIDK